MKALTVAVPSQRNLSGLIPAPEARSRSTLLRTLHQGMFRRSRDPLDSPATGTVGSGRQTSGITCTSWFTAAGGAGGGFVLTMPRLVQIHHS